jgi:hypothetical protein
MDQVGEAWVAWDVRGNDDAALGDLVEHLLRVLQSFVIDPGDPPKVGTDLRAYLSRWVAPAVDVQGQVPRPRRRPSGVRPSSGVLR